MQIPGTFPEVGRHLAFDHFAVNHVTLPIHLQHSPHMTGNSNFLAGRRRCHHSTQFLRIAAYRIFLIFLEHPVELEGTDHPLPGQAYDQASLLRPFNVIFGDQILEQDLIIFLADPVEIAEPQHPVRQGRR